jgi:acyl carrier protein
MTNEQVGTEVKNLIAEIIEMEVDSIDNDASFVNDLGLDSLRALEVLAELEKKFGIEIPEEKLAELTTINKAISITLESLGQKAS